MNIITIKPIENREREYFAYYRDDFSQAVFAVSFKDTITGALSLNRFSEMIKTAFHGKNVDFFLSDKSIKFKSQAVTDALTGNTKEEIQ